MTKRTVLAVLTFFLILGTLTLPVENAEAVTGAAPNGQIEQATLTVLKQSLDILQAQLNVIAQRIQSPNRSPEEIQALAITLEGVRLSLLTVNVTLNTRALALAQPRGSETLSSPIAAGTQMISKVASPKIQEEQSETAVTVVAPEITAETEETAVAATAIGAGGGWKKTGRVIWIVVVAALALWVGYNESWKKRIAARGEKTFPKTV